MFFPWERALRIFAQKGLAWHAKPRYGTWEILQNLKCQLLQLHFTKLVFKSCFAEGSGPLTNTPVTWGCRDLAEHLCDKIDSSGFGVYKTRFQELRGYGSDIVTRKARDLRLLICGFCLQLLWRQIVLHGGHVSEVCVICGQPYVCGKMVGW